MAGQQQAGMEKGQPKGSVQDKQQQPAQKAFFSSLN
jgi:hypothetical protein